MSEYIGRTIFWSSPGRVDGGVWRHGGLPRSRAKTVTRPQCSVTGRQRRRSHITPASAPWPCPPHSPSSASSSGHRRLGNIQIQNLSFFNFDCPHYINTESPNICIMWQLTLYSVIFSVPGHNIQARLYLCSLQTLLWSAEAPEWFNVSS